MNYLNPANVHEALRRLRIGKVKVFGAAIHRFEVNPPLMESDLIAFEQEHSILLPEDYRNFLLHIGNGGAGPYTGIFPLGQMDGSRKDFQPWEEGDGFVGDLSHPFPLQSAWNDLTGKPDDQLSSTNESEYERAMDAFENSYWSSINVNGALPICHMGCALRFWLIVSGSERGNVWEDFRADYRGLAPVVIENSGRVTFNAWYRDWLTHCLALLP